MTWHGEDFPFCRGCGRTDRHHVRFGLCTACCDGEFFFRNAMLAAEVRAEIDPLVPRRSPYIASLKREQTNLPPRRQYAGGVQC